MNTEQKLFSILIPSWNNLEFLKICVASIRKNSKYDHQIIIHVNDGTDGTLEWVKQEGLEFTHSNENIGVCLAMNSMRPLVKTDYMFYINDDMYVLPGWDEALYEEIKRLPDNKFFLSGTMIQPHWPLDVCINANYGESPETFQEDKLLAEYKDYTREDWMGATWPPNIVHRDVWDLVGGYSIELTPGMYSDPDFTAKLWLAGVRYFKGLGNCRVYHFETKSTGRVKKNDGSLQFLLKWGMTNSTLRRDISRLGEPFVEDNVGKIHEKGLKADRIRSRLKALWKLATKGFGILSQQFFRA
jgi:glycosyltransferase involved in cell wall biosynthesis